MKTWLFNPFKYIAGGKALLLGLAAMLITSVLAWYGKYHLDGILDAHNTLGYNGSIFLFILEAYVDWLSIVLPLYLFGKLISTSSVRFIDMVGTLALSRYPIVFMLLLAIFLGPPVNAANPVEYMKMLMEHQGLMVQVIITGLLKVPFIIWSIALMYNAYTVSANLKGPKAIWSFVISIVIAEIISKLFFLFIIVY